jgi:plastocyanin
MAHVLSVSLIFLLSAMPTQLTSAPAPASHEVVMRDMKFDPGAIEVSVGDKVIWTNQDDRDHTVTAADGSFKSDNLNHGASYEHVFKKPGKFGYSCSYHPRMKGTITVRAAD